MVDSRLQPFLSIFWLLLMNIAPLSAQLPSDNTEDYTTAKNGIYLLQNTNDFLPLQGLDTLRPVLWSINLKEDAELYKTLNTYVPTGRLSSEQNGSVTTTWPAPIPPTTVPNLVILVVDGNTVPLVEQLVRPDLRKSTPVLIVYFGNVTTAAPSKRASIRAAIYSSQSTPWAQSLVAQLIFGAIGTPTRVSTDLPEQAPRIYDRAISMKAVDRLAFAPPAVVGMDAALLRDSIAAILADGLAHAAFPGAQIMVARRGTIVYHQTFGHHTEQNERPVQPDDLYDLASITKISSALPALIKWYGVGDFELDAQLSDYYPPAAGTNKADLTFRAMLSHHARLRPWIPYWQGTLRGNGRYPWSRQRDPQRINDYRFRWRTLRRDSSRRYPIYLTDDLWQHRHYQDRMKKAILKSPLQEKSEYRYSGLLFYLLPEIIERRTGRTYADYLNETFYRPLGAYTLDFNPAQRFPLSRVIPTERDSFFRMQLLHGYVHDEGAAMMGGLSANAGLFANTYDLAKLMQMYLNGGTYGGRRYLTQAAVDTFTSRHYAAADNRRGLGFDKPLLEYDAARSSVAEAASDRSFGHSGYTGTFAWADPERELLFLFLSNRVYPSRNNRGIYTRNIRPRVHTVIYRACGE